MQSWHMKWPVWFGENLRMNLFKYKLSRLTEIETDKGRGQLKCLYFISHYKNLTVFIKTDVHILLQKTWIMSQLWGTGLDQKLNSLTVLISWILTSEIQFNNFTPYQWKYFCATFKKTVNYTSNPKAWIHIPDIPFNCGVFRSCPEF